MAKNTLSQEEEEIFQLQFRIKKWMVKTKDQTCSVQFDFDLHSPQNTLLPCGRVKPVPHNPDFK